MLCIDPLAALTVLARDVVRIMGQAYRVNLQLATITSDTSEKSFEMLAMGQIDMTLLNYAVGAFYGQQRRSVAFK